MMFDKFCQRALNLAKFFIVLLIIFLYSIPVSFAKQELLDRVIAVVNDDVITQSEVDALLRPLYEQYMREYSGQTIMKMLAEAQQKILNQLIEDKLVYQEAVKRKIKATDADIENEMRMFKQHFGSEVDLEKALKNENTSLADLQERLKKQAVVRKLHETEVRSKVIVSPKELEQYYADHKNEFSSPEQVRVSSLTIKKSDESRAKGVADEEAQERIKALREKVLAGADFDKLVNENSEDKFADQNGKGRWIKRGEMISAVDEVIFKIEPGTITDVIETPIGYHVFKIVEKQNLTQKNFEQARDQIYDILFRKKSEERFDAWMENLRKTAYISIKNTNV